MKMHKFTIELENFVDNTIRQELVRKSIKLCKHTWAKFMCLKLHLEQFKQGTLNNYPYIKEASRGVAANNY